MPVKRITIRVSPELHQQLRRLAASQSVSLNALAVEALATYADRAEGQKQFPLRELSALLAPVAEAAHLTEEEMFRLARQVRRRVWEERYRETVEACPVQQEPA